MADAKVAKRQFSLAGCKLQCVAHNSNNLAILCVFLKCNDPWLIWQSPQKHWAVCALPSLSGCIIEAQIRGFTHISYA